MTAMDNDDQSNDDSQTKQGWEKPEILSFKSITESEGNGVAGFDFASELS